jgi:arsenite oxidase large subunit
MVNSIDRIPLPPTDAKSTNMTCHFCIVGCGNYVYKWPENTEGGRSADHNAFGLDFRRQLPQLSVTMTPAMHNVIGDKNGRRYNIMIVPDKDCVTQGDPFASEGLSQSCILFDCSDCYWLERKLPGGVRTH